MNNKEVTPDDIWQGDMLNRKAEAELLIAYIQSVSPQPRLRDDSRAFVLSVDGGYGEGKTYFLKRLAQQLELNHPVAYVDAWRDDLSDEPLTALAATLKRALLPLTKNHPEISSKFDLVLQKAGSVAKVAGKGLLKRGLGLLITKELVDVAETIIEGTSEAGKDAVNDSLKSGGQEIVDDTVSAMFELAPSDLMQRRIKDFESGQQAIDDLKNSLEALANALDQNGSHPPIVIIVDELDRCRPTYAIKLLEEVKHLFDVAGLVFIFGMHAGQLSESVNGAYGPGFDGQAYLARFFNRRYRLKVPALEEFVRHLVERTGIKTEDLQFLPVRSGSISSTYGQIAFHMLKYDLSARDAITVIEDLHTCWAIAGKQPLMMPLLLPLIISKVRGAQRGALVDPVDTSGELNYWFYDRNGSGTGQNWWSATQEFHRLASMTVDEFNSSWNGGDESRHAHLVSEFRLTARGRGNVFGDPSRYADLIDAVGRITNPKT